MSNTENTHIEANTGPDHYRITTMPLEWKGYHLQPAIWKACMRKRLRVPVYPAEKYCPHNCGFWNDVHGNHAVWCSGGSHTNIRHNTVRDIVAKAAKEAGFTVLIEQKAPRLKGKQAPGDLTILNWRGGRKCHVDIMIMNPLCKTYVATLEKDGVGAVATLVGELRKETKYRAMREDDFIPFIVETSGGVGQQAKD